MTVITRILWSVLAVALGAGAAPAGGPGGGDEKTKPAFELVVRTSALVRGTDVRIADVCDVLPAGHEAAAIGAIVLGPTPVPGYSRAITRNEMLQALVVAGHPAGRFAVKGANETLVQGVVTELPAGELTEAANTALRALLEQERADVETEVISRVRHLQVPPGRQSLEMRARVRSGQLGQTSALVDVEVMVDGERFKTVAVQYRITRYRQVLKTLGPIRAGAPLGPENLAFSREKASETPGLYVTTFDAVAGMIARRNLSANQLITLTDVSEPALIRRGELVTVVLTRGNIKVTAKGIANHDAIRGENVVVTNAQSRAQITGIAAAPGTVVVPVGN